MVTNVYVACKKTYNNEVPMEVDQMQGPQEVMTSEARGAPGASITNN